MMSIFHRTENNCVHFVKFPSFVNFTVLFRSTYYCYAFNIYTNKNLPVAEYYVLYCANSKTQS